MQSYRTIVLIPILIIFYLIIFPSNSFSLPFSLPSVRPGATQELDILGSTVTIKGQTDQENTLTINGRAVTIQKDGSFQEEIIIPLGETEIVVTVTDPQGKSKVYTKKIKAEEKHFFLVGIADLTFNEVGTPEEGLVLQRDNASFNNGFHVNGKLSYYLVGKIKGKYLIKSALDTDKATEEKLFSNIDPDEYYPIYGDNSSVVYDVNSQGKFYLLVEWDNSGLTFGNYQTMLDDTKLAKYNRTLYGGKFHLQAKDRTIYGEPAVKFTGFVAEANQHAGHSEFLATGGSLYYLRHRNIVEGSEQVSLEIRDKNTGMTIRSIPQEENIDYEIKYNEGRLLFNKPVLSVAVSDSLISDSLLEGNSIYIVTKYEYSSQEAFPLELEDLDSKAGGMRVAFHVSDYIRLGSTYFQEAKDTENHQVLGQDITIKLGNFTKLEAEFAQSDTSSISTYISYDGGLDFIEVSPTGNDVSGSAQYFRFNSSLGEFFFGYGEEFLHLSAYYQSIGTNFTPSDSLFEAGTKKYGAELSHRFSQNDNVKLFAHREQLNKDSINQAAENQITARRVSAYGTQWTHVKDKLTFTTEYQHRRNNDSLSSYDTAEVDKILAERISYQLNDNTSLYLGQQLNISGDYENQTQVGINTKLLNDTEVAAQGAFAKGKNGVLLGLAKNIDENTSTYVNYSFVNSKIDGKSSITSFGTNSRIDQSAELRTERQFVTNDTRGLYATDLVGLRYQPTPRWDFDLTYQRREEEEETDPNLIAVLPKDSFSLTAAYAKPDKLKINSKFEFREDSNETDQVLTDSTAELKLTQDLFLFGEYDYYKTKEIGDPSYAETDIKHLGLAFRPVDYDWLNCLFKYIRMTEHRPENLTSADYGFVKMQSDADIFAAEFALDFPNNFQLVEKVSYKDEETLSYEATGTIKVPEDLEALLWVNRINYHATKQWDLAMEYRRLSKDGSDAKNSEEGLLFEISRNIFGNAYLGIGYNLTSFTDDFTEENHSSARGLFFRLQGKY